MRYASVQICGIILLLTIIFLSDRKKPFKLSGMRAFHAVLYAVLICLVLDITSITMIYLFADRYEPAADIICKLYLTSIMAVGISMYRYTLAGLFGRDYRIILLKVIGWIFTGIAVIYIMISPISRRYDAVADMLYTEGESVAVTYACMGVLVGLTFAVTIMLKDRIFKLKAHNIQIYSVIMLACGITQLADRQLLLSSFAMALGAAILFEKVENPNRYMDTESGLYNAAAFKAYISENYELRRPIYCMRVALNTGRKDMTMEENNDITEFFSRFLEREHGIAFRTNSYTFALISDKPEYIETAKTHTYEYLIEANANMIFSGIRSMIYTITDQSLFRDATEMISSYYRLKSYKIAQHEDVEAVAVDEKILAGIKRREQVKRDISSALEENRVETFYQPIYDVKEDRFTSAEALVRIRSREGELIPPSEFIPIAEETELIVPLGERIFSLVCEFLGSDRKPKSLEYVEVNLSAVQCKRNDLYNVFKDIMEREGVSPEQINMEITETVQLVTSKKVTRMLEHFRNDGIHFSLDDFGTGNSNLDYIANVPMISIVKFDHSMTQGFFTNDRIRAALPLVIKIIKNMKLKIVCEGVETEDQLDVMKKFGIDYIQGFYFSKPLPEAEFIDFVNNHNNKKEGKRS